jgi:hypothetical protein
MVFKGVQRERRLMVFHLLWIASSGTAISLTLGLWNNKTSTFTVLVTFCTHIFKLFSQTIFFFQSLFLRLGQRQKIAFIQIFHFSWSYIE